MVAGLDFVNPFHHPSTTSSLIFISTYVNNKFMKIMIDTGSQHCFINKSCLKNFDQLEYSPVTCQQFFMADGLTSFKVNDIVQLKISVGNLITHTTAFVTTHLCTDILLGMDYLSKYDLEINPKKKSLIFKFNDQQIFLPIHSESLSNQNSSSFSNTIQSTTIQQLNTITLPSYNPVE